MESGDTEASRQLIYDYRKANLTPAQKAFCDYAVKLTLTPGKMTEEDILGLRTAGYSDEQISLGVQVIGYFNYINRVADGLGVEDEDWMQPGHDEWKRRKADFANAC